MVLQELKEFCCETSIHGPSHIVNAQNSILKRLLWFAIFVGCLAYAGNQLAISIKGKGIYYRNLNVDMKKLSNGNFLVENEG